MSSRCAAAQLVGVEDVGRRARRVDQPERHPAAAPRRGPGSSPSAAPRRSRRRPAAPASVSAVRQTNQPPTGPRSSTGSPIVHHLVQVRRDLAVLAPAARSAPPGRRPAPRRSSSCAGSSSRPARSAARRRAGRRGDRASRARRRPASARSESPRRPRPGSRPATRAGAGRSVALVPLLAPRVTVVVVAGGLPEARARPPGSAGCRCTHLADFQKYRWGTSSRAGPPCAGSSGAPSYSYAIQALPSSRSSSGRLVV